MNAQELQDSLDSLETAESKCKKRKLPCMDQDTKSSLLDYMLIKELVILDSELLKSDQEIKSQKETIDNLKKIIDTSNIKLIEKFDLKVNAYYFCLVFSFLINIYLSFI